MRMAQFAVQRESKRVSKRVRGLEREEESVRA